MPKLNVCPFCKFTLPDHHKSCSFRRSQPNAFTGGVESVRIKNIQIVQKPHSVKRVK